MLDQETYDTRTLAQRLATQYADKAARCFRDAKAHASVNPNSRHVAELAAEGMHWIRAKRAALRGETAPRPWRPEHRGDI